MLLGTDPPDGARLEAAPEAVHLRFSEPVRPVAVRALGPEGEIETGEAVAGDGIVTLPIAQPLVDGGYVVTWRVISTDGHPIAGSIVFGIGAAPETREVPASAGSGASVAAGLNRVVLYGALLAASGGAFFLLLVLGPADRPGRNLRASLHAFAAVAAAALLLAIGLAGAELAGPPLSVLATLETWRLGVATSLAPSAAAGIAGLAVLTLGLALRPGRLAAAAMAGGSLLSLVALILTGHAATAPPQALASAAVYLHVLAAAFWLGSLWPLLVVLRHTPPLQAQAATRRFSCIAIGAVAVLVVAGAILGVLQVGAPSALISTVYGRLLILKLVFVLALLVLAYLNRRMLTSRLAEPGGRGLAIFCRSVTVEIALMIGVVAATGLLGQTPPPRALAIRAAAHHHAGDHHASAVQRFEAKKDGLIATRSYRDSPVAARYGAVLKARVRTAALPSSYTIGGETTRALRSGCRIVGRRPCLRLMDRPLRGWWRRAGSVQYRPAAGLTSITPDESARGSPE